MGDPTRSRLVAPWLILVGGGCFVGNSAEGLYCEDDRDCGIRLACIDNVCGGGAVATTTATTTTDETGTTTTDEATETTASNPCEDSEHDECNPLSNPDTCTPDCRLVRCGDGIFDEGYEGCDTSAPNGLPAGAPEDALCTSDCYMAAFWDDMQDAEASAGKWETIVEIVGGDPPRIEGWQLDEGSWGSGEYLDAAGLVILRSQSFDLPERPPGTQLELRIAHTWDFLVCASSPGAGGVIRVTLDGGLPDPVPFEGETGEIEDNCTMDPSNPLAGASAVIGSGQAAAGRVVLDDYAGQVIRVELVAAYDCYPCDPHDGDAWQISDVVVAPFPIE
jgi:hypothetical protein